MQINIPENAEGYVMGKAAAAGFADVSEYVIRKLRADVPTMTSEEIVQLVAEGRERCPQ